MTHTALPGDLNLSIHARESGTEDTTYRPLATTGLRAEVTTDSVGDANTPHTVRVRLTNTSKVPWQGVVHVELSGAKPVAPRFFLPAFMYGRNRGEAPMSISREWPRLRPGSFNRPANPWWMTRADRLSHPVAMVHDDGRLIGLSAPPYLVRDGEEIRGMEPGDSAADFHHFTGFSCSLERGAVGFTLGYENAPLMFVQTAKVLDRAPLTDQGLRLQPGQSVHANLAIYDRRAPTAQAVTDVVEQVYWDIHQPPREVSGPEQATRDLATAVHDNAWLPQRSAYSCFVFEEPDGSHRFNELPSISWTNGLVVATPLLLAGLRTGHEQMRQRATSAIDHIVNHSINPASGLPFDSWGKDGWRTEGWWFDGMSSRGHSGYMMGQAVYLVLKAYDYERRLGGVDREHWLDFARSVLAVLERSANGDGEFPYVLSQDTGAGLEYDSLGSSWIVAAALYLRALTGEPVSDELVASAEHYHRTYVQTVEGYGAPLDTNRAVDSEGVVGLAKAWRHLHGITGSAHALDRLRAALGYEFTFRFAYNTPIQVPPLSRLGWSSTGGSVTSTANPHIHPMGSTLGDEMAYYLGQREDDYLRARLDDTVAWGTQTYNTVDREFDHGKVGWMSERFCHSEGLLTQRYPDGSLASTWFALMPWASGCVIDSFVGDYWEYAGLPTAR